MTSVRSIASLTGGLGGRNSISTNTSHGKSLGQMVKRLSSVRVIRAGDKEVGQRMTREKQKTSSQISRKDYRSEDLSKSRKLC
ncbi:hypothetical protein Tco_0828277 [Tanacetum coccineum]